MRKKEDQKHILEASLQVFARFGYKKTTMEDIAQHLEMTKGNLYLYAKGKKDLYQKTAAFALLRWQEHVAREMAAHASPPDRFIAMAKAAVGYLSLDEDLRRLLIFDPDIFPMFPENDPYAAINENSKNIIRDLIQQGMDSGDFRKVDPEQTAEVVFSIYKMLVIRAYIQTDQDIMERMFSQAVDLVAKGLLINPNTNE